MTAIHTFRDGSIGVSRRELRRDGYDCRLDLWRAMADYGAPSWALDPSTCDVEHDEDGVRLYPAALS